MIKQILYFIFFISACVVMAQTTPKDSTQAIPVQTTSVIPTETVQSTITTTVITKADTTIQITPTQTLQPTTITTQTLHPTAPLMRHRRKKSESFKKENEEIAALYKLPFDRKTEIVLQNKRYRIYNNYVTAGIGKCYNSGWKDVELSTAVDYNFHVKRNHFQTGFLLAGPGVRNDNCIQLHVGWGYRFERCNYHWAAYGGVSYSNAYKLQTGYMQVADTTYKVHFSAVGVYANIQFFYKLKFDYGLGASAFIDANSNQFLTGLRIELFLSGAYKGFKKINYQKEEEKERF